MNIENDIANFTIAPKCEEQLLSRTQTYDQETSQSTSIMTMRLNKSTKHIQCVDVDLLTQYENVCNNKYKLNDEFEENKVELFEQDKILKIQCVSGIQAEIQLAGEQQQDVIIKNVIYYYQNTQLVNNEIENPILANQNFVFSGQIADNQPSVGILQFINPEIKQLMFVGIISKLNIFDDFSVWLDGVGMLVTRHTTNNQTYDVESIGAIKNNILQGNGQKRVGSGSIMKGTFKDGLLEGDNCEYIKNDIQQEKGTFVQGKLHGIGERKIASQNVYTGAFVNGIPEGYGQLINWKQDCEDIGIFQNSLLDGEGIRKFPKSQAQYTGQFKQGKYHGQGELVCKKYTYKGNFVNGTEQGYGEVQYIVGDYYKGNFDNGKLNGSGMYYSSTKKQTMTGTFIDDKFVDGELDYQDSENVKKYVGKFLNGKKNDDNCIYYRDNGVYKGSLYENGKTGKGIFAFNDAPNEFKATWKDGDLQIKKKNK